MTASSYCYGSSVRAGSRTGARNVAPLSPVSPFPDTTPLPSREFPGSGPWLSRGYKRRFLAGEGGRRRSRRRVRPEVRLTCARHVRRAPARAWRPRRRPGGSTKARRRRYGPPAHAAHSWTARAEPDLRKAWLMLLGLHSPAPPASADWAGPSGPAPSSPRNQAALRLRAQSPSAPYGDYFQARQRIMG